MDSLSSPPPSEIVTGPHSWTIGPREFVALMAMLQALQALAIDAMLPALARISHDLGATSDNQRQLVVGLFLVFAGVGSLVPGTLADRFGRRRVVIGCITGYIVLTIAAALVTTFNALLVTRALLGLASAGLTVLPPAIIRDRYDGDRMARLQSTISMVFMIVPMIAPTLGQAVLLVAGWRWIFGLMAALGAIVLVWTWFRLPETLHPGHRQTIHPAAIARGMHRILTTRSAIGYVLGMAIIQGALFGYINSAQQLVAEHFGAGTRFPAVFGGMALVMATTNFINSRIVERFGARRVSHLALIVYIAASLTQLALASSGHETLWSFVPMMTVNMCLMGFVGANFNSIAMQPFAKSAGAAASAQAFIRMVLASVLGSLIGQAYDGTARPLAMALLAAGSIAMIAVLFSERGRLFRRLNYPQKPQG
ncbi:MAG: multidrug effflux MFS transporter [Pseudomonadota bacterium]|nr:multidrug effflux MFS transporter [Pseudomonadota bacterium]